MTKKLKMIDDEVWYKEGLSFKCTGCGKCCTGSPGFVWISESEIVDLANHLKLTIDEFSNRYLRKVGAKYSLKELQPNYSCVFLKDNRCAVYEYRPKQCRTFPWWIQNLKNEEAWQEAANYCEGINNTNNITPLDEITKHLS